MKGVSIKLISSLILTLFIVSGCGTTVVQRGINDTDPPRTPDNSTSTTTTQASNLPTCFQNIGLKETNIIQLIFLKENTFSGTFTTSDLINKPAEFLFTGKKEGTKFIIKFEKKQVPPVLGNGENFTWELNSKNASLIADNQAILLVPIYGQDYTTKKYSYYPVEFSVCNSN